MIRLLSEWDFKFEGNRACSFWTVSVDFELSWVSDSVSVLVRLLSYIICKRNIYNNILFYPIYLLSSIAADLDFFPLTEKITLM